MTQHTVRLVPHASLSGAGMAFDQTFSQAPAETLSRSISPNKSAMRRAARQLDDRAVYSTASELNRLSVTVSEKDMREMFGAGEMRRQQTAGSERSITLNEAYDAPVGALEVPDSLKDTIAFAYVPRPAEFFSSQVVPPQEDIFHLRLSDVQMVLNAPRCHRNGWTGQGIKVAMADSGFHIHPWFIRSGARLIPTQSPGSGPADIDTSGHGTGEAANIFAMAPDCHVYGVKTGSSSAATLETCIAQAPHVMTNSWGYSIDSQSRDALRNTDPNMFFELVDIENVVASAIDRGISVLFSAGNGHLAFPASIPEVMAVGGVTVNEDGSLEASSYASAFDSQLYPGRAVPDVCGLVGRSEPGHQRAHIMLPVPPGSQLDGSNFPSGRTGLGWGIFSGTSAACPQAAGLVALLKQINKSLTPAQIKQVMNARSVDITRGTTATGVRAADGPDLATGAGLMDALRACGFAAPVA